MLHTTFNKARAVGACKSGYERLSRYLHGVRTYGADTPIPLDVIVESNGIKDAIWALRCTSEDSTAISRLFAVDCAEHVLPIFEAKYPDDKRVRGCIETTRRYLAGKATLYAANAAYDGNDAYAAENAAHAAANAAHAAANAHAVYEAEREWQAKRFLEILRESKGNEAIDL